MSDPWFIHHPDHMKGWEAFGCLGKEPIVRRLGTVTFRKGQAVTDEQPGTMAWGAGEVKLGVAGIEFGTFADSTDGGYLYIVGTTKEDVEARWHRAAAAFTAALTELWPARRG